MKLSSIKGDVVLDIIADLVDPVANIISDDEVISAFKSQTVPDGMGAREFFMQRMRDVVPKLIHTHKDDLVIILATVAQEDPKQYADNMTLSSLLVDVHALITDEELLSFLSIAEDEN